MRAELERGWACLLNSDGRPCTPTEYRRVVRMAIRSGAKYRWAGKESRLVFDSVMGQYWHRVIQGYALPIITVCDVALELERYEN